MHGDNHPTHPAFGCSDQTVLLQTTSDLLLILFFSEVHSGMPKHARAYVDSQKDSRSLASSVLKLLVYSYSKDQIIDIAN